MESRRYFLKDIVGIYLMKCDDEGNLIRDWRGLCVQSQPGEQGLVVGSIKESDPTRLFDGYLGENETNKKVRFTTITGCCSCLTYGAFFHFPPNFNLFRVFPPIFQILL